MNSYGDGNAAANQSTWRWRKTKTNCNVCSPHSIRSGFFFYTHFLNPCRCSFLAHSVAAYQIIIIIIVIIIPYVFQSFFLSVAFSTFQSIWCTNVCVIIIRSCFTVNRTSTTTIHHFETNSKNAISFCVVSHLVCLFTWLFISLRFPSPLLHCSIGVAFFAEKISLFLKISGTWWNGVIPVCMEMPFVIFKSNCHIHLISLEISVQCTMGDGSVHIMPHVISNPNVLVILKWKKLSFSCSTCYFSFFRFCTMFIFKYIVANEIKIWKEWILSWNLFQSIPDDNCLTLFIEIRIP